jgi:hypothetical protein
LKTDDAEVWAEEESFPVAILDDTTTLMRGSINGVQVDYTNDGWLIDYSQRYVRVQIIERKWLDMDNDRASMSNDALGDILRASKAGDFVKLKLAIGNKVEYEGDAQVQMIRFRARRKYLPTFIVQLKLSDTHK